MSIIRTFHNKENPWVELNKAALWDDRLSLAAVGLWSRCLSRPDNWKFHVTELAKRCKVGRKAIYGLISELINAGYAIRVDGYEKNEKGKFRSKKFSYVFFEFALSEEDKVRYTEEFKKSFRESLFGDLRAGDLRKEPLLRTKEETKNIEENSLGSADAEVDFPLASLQEEEEPAPEDSSFRAVRASEPPAPPPAPIAPKAPPRTSPEAGEVYALFLGKLRENRPAFKEPNRLNWLKDLDLLLRVDGRPLEEVKRVIAWTANDPFWSTVCLSPAKLRKNYDALCLKMGAPNPSASVSESKRVMVDHLKEMERRLEHFKSSNPAAKELRRLEVCRERVEFSTGATVIVLEMKDKEFEHKAIDMMNRMGIPLPSLKEIITMAGRRQT